MRNHSVAQSVIKSSPHQEHWRLMEESIPVRNLTAVQSVNTNALTQVLWGDMKESTQVKSHFTALNVTKNTNLPVDCNITRKPIQEPNHSAVLIAIKSSPHQQPWKIMRKSHTRWWQEKNRFDASIEMSKGTPTILAIWSWKHEKSNVPKKRGETSLSLFKVHEVVHDLQCRKLKTF